jgi:hypothetical protein
VKCKYCPRKADEGTTCVKHVWVAMVDLCCQGHNHSDPNVEMMRLGYSR